MAIIYHPTNNFLCALGYVLCISSIFGQDHLPSPKETEIWEPEPATITFDANGIPSDAIVLFDGTNLSKWQSSKGNGIPPSWAINDDGSMTVTPGKGGIETIEEHGSIQLHIEWKSPDVITGKGQGRGNSGIIFQRRYEVQVLDSYQNRTYSNGQAASIYKQHIPLVNATKPPSEWQVYDIIFIEPTFNEQGETITSGRFTVFHNGVIVQNSVEILGTTEYIGAPKRGRNDMPGYDADTSTDRRLYLQDHGDYMSYRNIWMRRL